MNQILRIHLLLAISMLTLSMTNISVHADDVCTFQEETRDSRIQINDTNDDSKCVAIHIAYNFSVSCTSKEFEATNHYPRLHQLTLVSRGPPAV